MGTILVNWLDLIHSLWGQFQQIDKTKYIPYGDNFLIIVWNWYNLSFDVFIMRYIYKNIYAEDLFVAIRFAVLSTLSILIIDLSNVMLLWRKYIILEANEAIGLDALDMDDNFYIC